MEMMISKKVPIKILVIGRSGFLGLFLSTSLSNKDFEVDSVGRETIDLAELNLKKIDVQLMSKAYDYAVICAAITDVEKCFENQTYSQRVNVDGTIALLDILQQNRITPIFFSSDYVFRPTQSTYREDDERFPETCYGRQKLAVEAHLEQKFDRYLIFRTSKLMSKTAHSKNILLPIIRALSAGQTIKCFEDQWLNPVFVEDISEVIRQSCLRGLNGAFHLGTSQIVTRFALARSLAKALGFDSALIQPTSLKKMTFSEERPTHNTLCCEKIEKALDFRFQEIIEATEDLVLMKPKRMSIRRAISSDASELSQLAMRSKAYWPYPADYLQKCVEVLRIDESYIHNWPIFIAEHEGRTIGFFALKNINGEDRLDHLWIDPPFIKKGFGKLLFERAIEEARSLKWSYFRLAADPYALEFYLKLGGRQIGTVQSRIKPDLFLPHIEVCL